MNPKPPSTEAVDPARALDAVGQAVVVSDPGGTVTFWNRGAEVLYGWSAAEATGRALQDLVGYRALPAAPANPGAPAARVAVSEPWGVRRELPARRADGSTVWVMVRDTEVRGGDDDPLGVISVSEDITARRWAEEALQRSEQRLRLALAAGRLGVWEWDSRTGEVVWDRTLEEIFGLPPGGAPRSFEAYLALLHPEDRPTVVAAIERALQDGEPFRVEHRVVWPDRSVRWVQGDGQARREGQAVVGLIGVSVDVTERHEAEVERARLLAEEAAARREVEAARVRLEFLADATAAMSEPFGLAERLRRLTRLGVPRFADACAVFLVDDSGQPEPIAYHHRDPGQEELLGDLLQRYPARLESPAGVGAAIRTATTTFLPEVRDEFLVQVASSEQHLAGLRSLHITAGVVVPLVGPEGAFGAVAFITVDGRRMSREDLTLAEELCDRISISVYNGQLLEAREFERAAHRYQAALLQSVFEASVDGMVAVDPEGRVLAHNHRFLELWGLDEGLVELGDEALLAAAARTAADPEGFLAGVRATYASGVPRVHDEVVLSDGRVLDRHGTRVVDEDGRYLGFTWSFRDVTGERAQQAEVAAVGERFATLARTLQQSLLPPTLPNPGGVELAARYHPAFEGVDVGGDFYDVFAVGDDWVLVIGDVCGKGAEAAALTALARYTIRAAAIHDADPATTLVELNTAMLADSASSGQRPRFATVCCIRLRTTAAGIVADVACGGHPLPLIVRTDGSIEPGGAPGTLLGLFPTVRLSTTSTLLRPGDTLVAVTDGVLEARDDQGRLLDVEGLAELLADAAGRPAAEVGRVIEERALAVQGGVARDDIAVLVARIR